MSAAVISGADATPVFEACDHVLDLVALVVEGASEGMASFRLDFPGMRATMPRLAGSPEPVRVVALVGENSSAFGMADNVSAAPF